MLAAMVRLRSCRAWSLDPLPLRDASPSSELLMDNQTRPSDESVLGS
jgi:hypothetical protein